MRLQSSSSKSRSSEAPQLSLQHPPSSPMVPTHLTLPPSNTPHLNGSGTLSPPSRSDFDFDFDFVSIKPPPSPSSVYTSLRDILPAPALCSPTPASAANSGYEISIRNRLVKQAAWAYLQPMASSPDSSRSHFLRRFWLDFSSDRNPFSSCLGFIRSSVLPSITRAYTWVLRVIGVCVVR